MPGNETFAKRLPPSKPRRKPDVVAIISQMLSAADESTDRDNTESNPPTGMPTVSVRQREFQAHVVSGNTVSACVGKAKKETELPVKSCGAFSAAKGKKAKPKRPHPKIKLSCHTAEAVKAEPRDTIVAPAGKGKRRLSPFQLIPL